MSGTFDPSAQPTSLDLPEGEPLIAIPLEENGRRFVRYFAGEQAANNALSHRARFDVGQLAGVWADLDWDAFADELDQIRHQTKPTPIIELDV